MSYIRLFNILYYIIYLIRILNIQNSEFWEFYTIVHFFDVRVSIFKLRFELEKNVYVNVFDYNVIEFLLQV